MGIVRGNYGSELRRTTLPQREGKLETIYQSVQEAWSWYSGQNIISKLRFMSSSGLLETVDDDDDVGQDRNATT